VGGSEPEADQSKSGNLEKIQGGDNLGTEELWEIFFDTFF
tara:strand:+ start:2998 stop:3117 length:120 start_codon:yes stop_codon:yes gene_type:complete